MKRLLSFALVIFMLAALTACGSGTNTPEPTAAPTEEQTAAVTADPTAEATAEPTEEPTTEPTAEPTAEPTPEPLPAYDSHDVAVLRAFFEQSDNGVKNGEKLFSGYDPDDPATWYDEGAKIYANAVWWSENGRARALYISALGDGYETLAGELDLTELDELTALYMRNDTVGSFTLLSPASFSVKNSAWVRVFSEGEAKLTGGYVDRIYLVSAARVFVEVTGDAETELTDLPSFRIEVNVEGQGYAGVNTYDDENYYEVHLCALPDEGHSFLGWFDANGERVSENEDLELFGENTAAQGEVNIHGEFVFTAKFD